MKIFGYQKKNRAQIMLLMGALFITAKKRNNNVHQKMNTQIRYSLAM